MNTLDTETERRLNNVINLGIVTEVNYDEATCRVQIDGNETDFLPFGTVRMGNVKVWNPPMLGEQVQVISENGELDTAVVMGSFSYEKHEQPSNNQNSVEIHCKDGAVFSYDHSSHHLNINLPGESSTTMQSNAITVNSDDTTFNCQNFTINCDNYNLNSKSNNQDGTLVINNLPYLDHTHEKVTPGLGMTGGIPA